MAALLIASLFELHGDRRTYLAGEFNLLSSWGPNPEGTEVVFLKINEYVAEIENPETLWDDLIKRNTEWLEGQAAGRSLTGQPGFVVKDKPTVKPDKIFLGHGRSLLWRAVERWLEKDKHVLVEAWESESHAGEQVVEVLERLLDSCTFAVLIVTGEDATADGTLRARQNVIHEIGLFQGKLGFKRVALLEQKGTESFSNIHGLQTIPFPGETIEAAFPALERMLKREGLIK